MTLETELSIVDFTAWSIFNGDSLRRKLEIGQSNQRFVHYTSAEVACSILREREVWMRRPQVMNDFQEIEWGWNCLIYAWNQGLGGRLKTALDGIFPGSGERIIGHFEQLLPAVRTQTYITCVSEHDDAEDQIGRLSMWRAYGGHAGVALVLNTTAFTSVSDVFNAYSHPVWYHSRPQVAERVQNVLSQMAENESFLRAQGEEFVHGYVSDFLTSVILCTKHPGFREEREWRIIHNSHPERNPNLRYFSQIVRGIPQQVVAIPLMNFPDQGLVGAAIPELINRVIIGPNEYAWESRAVLIDLLGGAGVENAGDRVWVSDIPVRQQS